MYRAYIHYKHQNYESAIQDYNQVILVSQSTIKELSDFDKGFNDDAYQQRGWSYQASGQNERAISDYCTSLSRTPNIQVRNDVKSRLEEFGVVINQDTNGRLSCR
jgi:hypothetical protein